MSSKWLKNLRAELEAQSFEIRETKKGWQVIPPDPDAPIVTIHLTYSDHRAEANILSLLKKSGFLQRRK